MSSIERFGGGISRRNFLKIGAGSLGLLLFGTNPSMFSPENRPKKFSQLFDTDNFSARPVSAWPRDLMVDTWWYAMTKRWTREECLEAARLRVEQGFNAVQFVVGVPPEIGPAHPAAESDAGFPYDLKGWINRRYFDFVGDQITDLNNLGLKTIVVGAWGQQIEWLGVDWMKEWWSNIVESTRRTNSLYCLTGESNLMLGSERALPPNKSNDDVLDGVLPEYLRTPLMLYGAQSKEFRWLMQKYYSGDVKKRTAQWSEVLQHLHQITDLPIIIHTCAGEISENAVNNPELLAAVTTQTGHEGLDNRIFKLPMQYAGKEKPFVDMEHIYEGINGRFYGKDQLLTYWASRIAGADGFYYGAHGLWQLGDGKFMRHWGTQDRQQALALETPKLLGESDRVWREYRDSILKGEIFYETNGELSVIGRRGVDGKSIIFYPDAANMGSAASRYFLPETGKFTDNAPIRGQVVAIDLASHPEIGKL